LFVRPCWTVVAAGSAVSASTTIIGRLAHGGGLSIPIEDLDDAELRIYFPLGPSFFLSKVVAKLTLGWRK
jgi:hypothetical protein